MKEWKWWKSACPQIPLTYCNQPWWLAMSDKTFQAISKNERNLKLRMRPTPCKKTVWIRSLEAWQQSSQFFCVYCVPITAGACNCVPAPPDNAASLPRSRSSTPILCSLSFWFYPRARRSFPLSLTPSLRLFYSNSWLVFSRVKQMLMMLHEGGTCCLISSIRRRRRRTFMISTCKQIPVVRVVLLCGRVEWRQTDTCITGDSVCERGRKSGRRKKKHENERRLEEGESDAEPKVGQIHFQGLIPTKVFILIRWDEGVHQKI